MRKGKEYGKLDIFHYDSFNRNYKSISVTKHVNLIFHILFLFLYIFKDGGYRFFLLYYIYIYIYIYILHTYMHERERRKGREYVKLN